MDDPGPVGEMVEDEVAQRVRPGGGDVDGNAGYPPTDASVEVFNLLNKRLNAAKAQYRDLIQKELPAFNRSLAEHGVTPLVSQMPPSPAADAVSESGASNLMR